MNVILLLIVLAALCITSAVYLSPKALRLLAVWCLTRASFIEDMLEARTKANVRAVANRLSNQELCGVKK